MKSNHHTHTLSVIVPLYNEEQSIFLLYKELIEVLTRISKVYEIIFVDDGSRDQSLNEIEKLIKRDKHVSYITFRKNQGKAAALSAGFKQAKYKYIVTLDADLQDVPDQIPLLIAKLDEGYDLVSSWKRDRKDPFIKVFSSIIFNSITRWTTGVDIHDYNSGLKAYRKEVVDSLYIYGELHRYIPVLVAHEGYRITEVHVTHRRRKYGTTKYNYMRFINGFLDLLTVIFITRFQSSPLHFFGYIGLLLGFLGMLLGVYLTFQKVFYHENIGTRPLLLLAVLLIILGVQLTMTGLLGEQMHAWFYKRDSQIKKGEK